MNSKQLPEWIRASKLAKKTGMPRRTICSLIRSGAIEGKFFSLESGRKSWWVTREAYIKLVPVALNSQVKAPPHRST